MKIFNKFFKKEEEVELTPEEQEKLDVMINENSSEVNGEGSNLNVKSTVNLEEFVMALTLNDIDKLRTLVDKREEQLLNNYGLSSKADNLSYVDVKKPKFEGEIEVKDKVTDEDLNDKTTEVKFDEKLVKEEKVEEVTTDDLKKEFVEDKKFISEDEIDISSEDEFIEIEDENYDSLVLELNDIFGDLNVTSDYKLNSSYDVLRDKKHFEIKIKLNNAKCDEVSIEDQNGWFVENIKKFSELKNFKIVDSTPMKKDLFWDKDVPILISYEAIY